MWNYVLPILPIPTRYGASSQPHCFVTDPRARSVVTIYCHNGATGRWWHSEGLFHVFAPIPKCRALKLGEQR